MDKELLDLAVSIRAWWKTHQHDVTGERGERNVCDQAPDFVAKAKLVLGDWDSVEATDTLHAADIVALADRAGAAIQPEWLRHLQGPRGMPLNERVLVWFNRDAPDEWEAMMSKPVALNVSVMGTRIATGSGATDGMLKDCYAQRLEAVNAQRRARGLMLLSR